MQKPFADPYAGHNMNMNSNRGLMPNNAQHGVALIFALIVLLVVTLLGLAAIRSTTIFQRITANFSDREIAFQAAEAGLAAGAQLLSTTANIRNCGQGGVVCPSNPFLDSSASDFIQTVASGTGTGQFTTGPHAPPGTSPQFVIENMGTWPDLDNNPGGGGHVANVNGRGNPGTSSSVYYRITARSSNPAYQVTGDRAVVTLQAMYRQ